MSESVELVGELRNWDEEGGFGSIVADGRMFFAHGRRLRYADGKPFGGTPPVPTSVKFLFFPFDRVKPGSKPIARDIRLREVGREG